MSVLRVITGFSRLRDEELDTLAQSVIEKMTGNANFATPNPPLAEVTTALTEYQLALAQAQNGGTEKTALKRFKRNKLEALLIALGTYVQTTAKSQDYLIISSGFTPFKTRTPRGLLDKPRDFSVETGPNPGSVVLSVRKVNGADKYLFEHAHAPITETTQWTVDIRSSRNFTVEGLTSGEQYAFRVTGIGTNPTRVYTDVITRYVH